MSIAWRPPFLSLPSIDCVKTVCDETGTARIRVNFLAEWYCALTWYDIVEQLRNRGVKDENIDLEWDFSIFPRTTFSVGPIAMDIRNFRCPFHGKNEPVEYDITPLVAWLNLDRRAQKTDISFAQAALAVDQKQ